MAAPTWDELWRALVSHPRPALSGTYAVTRPRRDPGNGLPPGSVATSETFAFRPPGAWRRSYDDPLGHADGPLSVTTAEDSDDGGLSYGEDGFPWDFAESPGRLVHTLPGGPLAAAVPLSAPEATSRAGRPAWSVDLDVPLAGPLRVVVDAAAYLLLGVESPDGAYREELTGLVLPARLPDALFDPHEETAARTAWEERLRATELAWRGRPLPVPGHWPGPRLTPSVIDGDPASGLLVMDLGPDLGDEDRADSPYDARLARRKRGEPPYLGGVFGDPSITVHTWTDPAWQWSLATDGPPLTPADLAKVIASMPSPPGGAEQF